MHLWGGIECTVNRIGDRTFDQLERGGHAARIHDLDLIAELGLRTLRYPVLWERTAPQGLAQADWSWPDQRLGRLEELGIEVVAGLVHHGNGPTDTHLLEPSFGEKLADYARAVAVRYPHIQSFTPINEPLTTARFCGLYGHWYPHGQDPLTFARCLLNQCRATVLAMRAIREVSPLARLVQNEDVGKTYTTPNLSYQADFENERRWLTFDLLCGHVRPGHPMHQYLHWLGISSAELDWFLDNPCPPDMLGIDYYVTSERFLDDNLGPYPLWTHGHNGRKAYADVEAVRVCRDITPDIGAILGETWDRYHIPLAVTEAHLACTPDEQMRWLWNVWQGAQAARRRGVDVRAVTAWALFGAYDWNSLLTRWDGCYEPGVFDTRSGEPRPTSLTGLVRSLAAGQTPRCPELDMLGWWKRPERLLYPPVCAYTLAAPRLCAA